VVRELSQTIADDRYQRIPAETRGSTGAIAAAASLNGFVSVGDGRCDDSLDSAGV
jgi:hypothetical protein